MSTTAVGQCPQCHAVVNVYWPACLVCHTLLMAVPVCETEGPESAPPVQAQADPTEGITPTPPLQPGWLVSYRDGRGVLCGGCDDRQHGTVQESVWGGSGWTVHLTDGQRLPLSIIRSVGRTDDVGKIVAAWTVREHGFDGEGSKSRG